MMKYDEIWWNMMKYDIIIEQKLII
jgi:hypothetical protein